MNKDISLHFCAKCGGLMKLVIDKDGNYIMVCRVCRYTKESKDKTIYTLNTIDLSSINENEKYILLNDPILAREHKYCEKCKKKVYTKYIEHRLSKKKVYICSECNYIFY